MNRNECPHMGVALQAICNKYQGRKLVKKWVAEKIKEVAERSLTGWLIKAEAPPVLPEPADQDGSEADAGRDAAQDASQLASAVPDEQSGAMLKFLGKVGELSSAKHLC